jgi:predicted ATP-grasp superfamily ATP-dependent carboligase
MLDAVPYPAIVKPRLSNFSAGGRQWKVGYALARTPAELVAAYRGVHARVPRPLIQQVVGGHGAGIFSIWDRGTPLAWFAHRRLREIDPRGGPAAAAMSVPVAHDLARCAGQLLKALRWHGVAMVEFRCDPGSGRFWLMEINGRFWGSLALALAAGVDFPWFLYRLAVGARVDPPASYRTGVIARDAVGEYKHFFRVIAGRRAFDSPRTPSRLATLREALTILHPWKDSFNWTDDDPAPGRREWRHVIARALWGRR